MKTTTKPRSKARAAKPHPITRSVEIVTRYKVGKDLEPLLWKIDALQPDGMNPRKRTPEAQKAIEASLARFGQQRPLLVHAFPGDVRPTVISGNGGLLAMRALHWTHVAAIEFEGTDEEARAYSITDNRTAELSEWDRAVVDLLEARMRASGTMGDLLEALDLESLIPEDADPDAGEPANANVIEPVARVGNRFQLGRHRLACGDSGDRELWRWLTAGADPASCVFTDPPYGVDYRSSSGQHAPIEGDELRGDALVGLLKRTLGQALEHTRPSAAWYVWHADKTRDDFAFALKALGLLERQYLVWAKPSLVVGHADYQQAHEPCFYMSRDGSPPDFYGDRAQSTIWRMAAVHSDGTRAIVIGNHLVVSDGAGETITLSMRPPKGRVRAVRLNGAGSVEVVAENGASTVWEISRTGRSVHPTQKPVALAERALSNSTLRGQVVLDPFAGSGSTLLAAERLGRRCLAVELEPRYVDAIISRWEQMTGSRAEKLG